MALRGRKAIRKAFREQRNDRQSYEVIGLSWGVSGGIAWKMINEDYYWPKDKEIEREIFLEASRRKIPLGNRGGRDLHSMSREELLWRLENREECDGHN